MLWNNAIVSLLLSFELLLNDFGLRLAWRLGSGYDFEGNAPEVRQK